MKTRVVLRAVAAAAGVCLVVLGLASFQDAEAVPWVQDAKLTASDGAAYDYFGGSVSLSGTTALIGADGGYDDCGIKSGAAYVFEDNGTAWVEVAKLFPANGATDDGFGWSVSLSGTTAIVGTLEGYSGSAYVFERDGGTWSQVAHLSPSDSAAHDFFGCSVSVSGTRAVVGARWDDDCGTRSGAAYVFEDNGTAWVELAKLFPSEGATGDGFGFSVALSGTTAIVGADEQYSGTDSGSAYVFEKDGGTWSQVAHLSPSDGAADDFFGCSVSISGTMALVGALCDNDCGHLSGSAYVFEDNGTHWIEVCKLTASDGDNGDCFGGSVSLSGTRALVGAVDEDALGLNSGSAYIFEPIPEPTTLGLVALGLGVAVLRRQRRG